MTNRIETVYLTRTLATLLALSAVLFAGQGCATSKAPGAAPYAAVGAIQRASLAAANAAIRAERAGCDPDDDDCAAASSKAVRR